LSSTTLSIQYQSFKLAQPLYRESIMKYWTSYSARPHLYRDKRSSFCTDRAMLFKVKDLMQWDKRKL